MQLASAFNDIRTLFINALVASNYVREVQLIQTLYFNAWRWKFLLIVRL